MRLLAHLSSLAGLVAVGLATGRFLRHPEPGAPLIGLLALIVVVAALIAALHRPAPPEKDDSLKFPVPADPRVDLNRAEPAELQTLPGVGPVAAQRIVERRPFAAVDDLLAVPGFGPAKLRVLADRVRV